MKNKKTGSLGKKSLLLHKKLKGKLSIESKASLRNREDLSLLYTPGVGAVSTYLAQKPKELRSYTIKGNCVAVISDGSAVLGLGNIGPQGALPVLEGKAVIFKEFAGVDAFPIALNTQDPNAIVETIKNISPIFGGINLEDISAPRCFEIEERLKQELDIPVMHDDQHGTAIVVLAALLNALRVVRKSLEKVKIVVNGAGPAGVAVAKLLLKAGAKNIVVLDSKGILVNTRELEPYKKELAEKTNSKKLIGGIDVALENADVFIGVSRGNLLTREHIKLMARDPIVFALANPVPEIMPDEARAGGAKVVATGRSDFPNQINNALVFPGIFRGALDRRVTEITDEIKLNAALALASLIRKPSHDEIIPSIFDKRVVKAISRSIK